MRIYEWREKKERVLTEWRSQNYPRNLKVGDHLMAFTFAAFCYLFSLFAVAFCIFFAIFTYIIL
ncbi:hypothetical protein X798_08052 [Onchocerca flexuosa]|uniref:Uncharacterized protein n=1 Tax=Onchocerca flexuosa TaxID=387005 RepID=A0A238BK83_9BILA|nr:hypothetical protein X798_08052 [Onchocerca flexuosa]